jgi:carbohydrate kinase (thermoresistant glucokinase family)
MGPSGSGKTTVGLALAAALDCDFADADDLHPEANIEKMRRGEPLTDDDRWPWLARVADVIAAHKTHDRSVVIACSALKRIYRDRLREADPELILIVLDAPAAVLESRLKLRAGHFMPASLIASQIATLEPPGVNEHAHLLDATQPVDRLVARVVAALR